MPLRFLAVVDDARPPKEKDLIYSTDGMDIRACYPALRSSFEAALQALVATGPSRETGQHGRDLLSHLVLSNISILHPASAGDAAS